VWITHDLSVISGLADDVSVMYAGRIVESGSVDEILARPMHRIRAGFWIPCRAATCAAGRWRRFPA
jgi:ABC-type dipeptide/oligopeptide/nickel transport system ATPase component